MTILALDLGTTTGFALYDNHSAKTWGTWSFKPGQFQGGGMRYLRFRQQLTALHGMRSARIRVVYFEEVRAHKGCAAAHIYGGLMGTLTGWCEEHGVPYQGVPVGTIKKHATGKGNASKDDMMRAMQQFSPKNDNEADALALLDYVLTIIHEIDEAIEREMKMEFEPTLDCS